MNEAAQEADLKLGRWQATALAFSFVIGIGVLVLPTLALDIAGPKASFFAWIAMSVFAIPLIAVFSSLGKRHFREGGISVYCTEALGSWSEVGVHFCMLSALLLAMPGMVWVAGSMFSDLLGLSRAWTVLFSHLIITGICLNNLYPVRKSTLLSVASPLLITGVAIAVVGMNSHALLQGASQVIDYSSSGNGGTSWISLWKASVLIFFGYVGWESMSLCVKDLQTPERDAGFVYWGSFLSVSILYLLLAATVSGAALSGPSIGPMDGILTLIGNGQILAMTRSSLFLVLIANLNAWVLSGSRQLRNFLNFEAFKNSRLRSLAVSSEAGVPRRAVALYLAIVTWILIAIDLGRVTVSGLIIFANQNWILLYGGVLLFFWKKASSRWQRVLAFTATLSFLILASACSWQMAIALVIFLTACGLTYLLTESRVTTVSSVEASGSELQF